MTDAAVAGLAPALGVRAARAQHGHGPRRSRTATGHSHARRVPFSEAQFKTLKYRPDYPARFDSIEETRLHCQRFFACYNDEHHHSGPGLHTPADIHYGTADAVRDKRAGVLTSTFTQHPNRFVRKPPEPPAPPTGSWINPPDNTKEIAH